MLKSEDSANIGAVLSLFDGISCGRVALDKAGVKYSAYYASEIDSGAIKIAKKNYPSTIHIGDVHEVKASSLPAIDLLIGGSPCQSFSNMGHKTGFDGKSGIFWEYVRVLEECRPKHFLFENVSMKREWRDVITDALGVKPLEINSKHFVPQSRKRLYWTNILLIPYSKGMPFSIKDILQDADESYFLTELQKSKLNLNFQWKGKDIISHNGRKYQQDIIYHHNGIMCCLASNHHGAAKHTTKTFLPDGRVRRLTEQEWELLQGLPIGYTEGVSSSKRYESIGNGWTVDVVSHIFRGLHK